MKSPTMWSPSAAQATQPINHVITNSRNHITMYENGIMEDDDDNNNEELDTTTDPNHGTEDENGIMAEGHGYWNQ